MAIDTSLFAAQVPAGTYAVGDKIPLACLRGPAVVRDGYGACKLKRLVTLADQTALNGVFKITIKNSNWVDSVSNPVVTPSYSETALSIESAAIQPGQDLPLVPNSGWEVVAECITGATTTTAGDLFALIDMDFPSVAGIENPRKVQGFPVTMDATRTITITGAGSALSAVWNTFNVDIFKAGSKYLLNEASFFLSGSLMGFMSISGAAGQAGLERIIPVRSSAHAGLKYPVDYSTPLVKGPMNVNFMVMGTAGTGTAYSYMDYVKKSI